jgi:hypothetical protein
MPCVQSAQADFLTFQPQVSTCGPRAAVALVALRGAWHRAAVALDAAATLDAAGANAASGVRAGGLRAVVAAISIAFSASNEP